MKSMRDGYEGERQIKRLWYGSDSEFMEMTEQFPDSEQEMENQRNIK